MITFKHASWEHVFELTPHKLSILAAEESGTLWKYCVELLAQAEGEAGNFGVWKDYKEQSFEKLCSVETNLAGLTLNTKKLQTALVKKCAERAGSIEWEETLRKTSLALYRFCKDVCQDVGYSTELDENIDVAGLFKLHSLSFKEEFPTLLEKLVEYVNISVEFTKTKIFIFLFLTKFLTQQELNAFFSHCKYQGVSLLLLEKTMPPSESFREIACQGLIIDKDNCEIPLNF